MSAHRIVPCSEWGARAPKQPPVPSGRAADHLIFHHTDGHHPQLDHVPTESPSESRAYARGVQSFHMNGNGWNDSGHNYLVCRNGLIYEGRRGSLAANTNGHTIVSAHCPGQNHNPGVEIEHKGNEPMTKEQYDAAVWLFAWLCKRLKLNASAIHGHREFFATDCPGVLFAGLDKFRRDVAATLAKPVPKPKPPAVNPTYLVTLRDERGKVTKKRTKTPGDWLSRFGVRQHKIVHGSIDRL